MEDDEEDIYAPVEEVPGHQTYTRSAQSKSEKPSNAGRDEDEEEEDEEEESDSDIDIITERQDGGKPEAVPQSQRISIVKALSTRIDSPTDSAKPLASPAIKVETSTKPSSPAPSKPGSTYPPHHASSIDVDAKPTFEPTGKPITEVDMDADFPEDDKPWRRPGTDTTDYFNYGFDEFTWASYCLKQETLRKEIVDQKKQMEEMQSFLGMPGMPAPSTSVQGAMPSMGNIGDMPPELQQTIQQMMAQGIDPSQMDFGTFSQMLAGGQGGMGGGQGFGQQGQNQQQMGYGYGGGHGGGGGNRNQGGRGQGRRY